MVTISAIDSLETTGQSSLSRDNIKAPWLADCRSRDGNTCTWLAGKGLDFEGIDGGDKYSRHGYF